MQTENDKPAKNNKSTEEDLLEKDIDLEGDRHEEKKPGEEGPQRKLLLQRNFLILGGYLVALALLITFIILGQSKVPTPPPESPGIEEEATEQTSQGQEIVEERSTKQEPCPEGEEKMDGTTPAAEQKASLEDPASSSDETREERKDEDAGAEGTTAGQLLPKAASPLPHWKIYSPFGSHVLEELPSGGHLHRLAQGVNLQATPGASVAALWDGFVLKVDRGSFYKNSVLLEHEGGHQTFYGNLQEVWVEEGCSVSRGENIGLLPHLPSAGGDTSPSEKSEIPVLKSPLAPSEEAACGPLPLKTVWKGYAWEKTIPQEGATAGTKSEDALPALASEEENPLLYLEVRLENYFLDPLEFIPVRN